MKILPFITVVSALALGSLAQGSTLVPGSPAPKLAVKTWYKGSPVTRLDPRKIYVVEFWATWCGPCKESIPHLTELAKKNPDVTFIGVSIWEDEKTANIPKFVKQMGRAMDYHVGYSGNHTGMAQTWMAAAGQSGIPTAFIVRKGKVEWIGHPMELEKPLAQVKSGHFNEAQFRKQVAKEKHAAQMQDAEEDALAENIKQCAALYRAGGHDEAKKKLDEIVKEHPEGGIQAEVLRLDWLAVEDPAAWDAQVTALSKHESAIDTYALCGFAEDASGVVPTDFEKARKAIQAALIATNNSDAMVLQSALGVFMRMKDDQRELDVAERLLQVYPDSPLKNFPGLGDQLKRTIADLKEKLKPQSVQA